MPLDRLREAISLFLMGEGSHAVSERLLLWQLSHHPMLTYVSMHMRMLLRTLSYSLFVFFGS